MKALRRTLAAVSAALLALTAGSALADPAQRWRHIGDGDAVMGFVDLASISRTGDLAKAQVMIVRDKAALSADNPMAYGVTSMEFDCKGKADRMAYVHIYNDAGAQLAEGAANKPMEAGDFSDPQTVVMFGLICDGAAPPAGADYPSVAAAVAWARAQRP